MFIEESGLIKLNHIYLHVVVQSVLIQMFFLCFSNKWCLFMDHQSKDLTCLFRNHFELAIAIVTETALLVGTHGSKILTKI